MEDLKVFDKWSIKEVKVNDLGLQRYIVLTPFVIKKSGGRFAKQQFHKSKMNIIERLMNKLMVPGHRGKKHVLTSGRVVGKYFLVYKIMKRALEKVEKQTGKNPIEVLVKAVENAALREETAAYQVGGIIVRRAVITSPQRRVDLVLKLLVQSAYRKSFGKKETIADALSNEIIAAYNNDASKSEATKERDRIEKEAEGAR